MPILHMETDLVRDVGNQLQQASASLQQQTQQLNYAVQNLTDAWQGMSASIFMAEIQPLLRHLNQFANNGELLNQRLQREVDQWERVAGSGAVAVGLAAAAIPAAGGGVVLGASTSFSIDDYRKMLWSDKYTELERLEEEIAALEKEWQGQEGVDGRIREIDSEIAELEAQLAEAQERAEAWYNKVIPTLPLQTDEDGVPWRVRTDNYEDDIASYEQRLQELRGEQNALRIIQDRQNQLTQLKMQQGALQTIVEEGIPADGPSTKHMSFSGTITDNCTKYASSKRYFPDAVNGNAYQWDDQASGAGYEVGTQPVKGSIIVFEPGIRGADSTNGHVAFVERVEAQRDGTYKVIYTDNSHTDPANPAEMIVTPGERGLSFIYDQKTAM